MAAKRASAGLCTDVLVAALVVLSGFSTATFLIQACFTPDAADPGSIEPLPQSAPKPAGGHAAGREAAPAVGLAGVVSI